MERFAGAVSLGWGSHGAESGYQVKGDCCRQRRLGSSASRTPSSTPLCSSTYSHLILIPGGQVRCETVPLPGCGPITGFSEE